MLCVLFSLQITLQSIFPKRSRGIPGDDGVVWRTHSADAQSAASPLLRRLQNKLPQEDEMDLLQKHLESEGEDKCPKDMEMEPCLHRSQKGADALKELSSLIKEKRAGLGRWLMNLANTQGIWQTQEELPGSLVFSQPVKWSRRNRNVFFL